MKYAKFDSTTGQMLSLIDTPVEITHQPENYLIKQVPDSEPRYFDFTTDEAVKCTEMPVEINGTEIKVPEGTRFRIRQPSIKGDDGETGSLEFQFSEPGEYNIVLYHTKHLTKEVTIDAS
jgi:hypothetical protein